METDPGAIAIVGSTASGKSALAHAIAVADARFEIVAVDSMQVYRGMTIGTASPTAPEREAVPYHLVDLVDPATDFDLASFQTAAKAALADIAERNRRALLVGGTALYLRSIVDDLELPGQFPEVRKALEREPDTGALHARLIELDPLAASRMDPANRRRVVRALEVCLGAGRPFSSFGPGLAAHPPSPIRLLGLRWENDALDARIAERYRQQIEAGFVDEVQSLLDGGAAIWSRTAARALGYQEIASHLRGECTLEAAIDTAVIRTRRFARRQMKWFARDPRITWLDGDRPDLVDTARAWIEKRTPMLDQAD